MDTHQSQLAKNSFIKKHLDSDVTTIALMKAPKPGWDMKAIAATIQGYQKIKMKLPTWYKTENLQFGPSLNVEQASSEITALFKQKLIADLGITKGADLCAGLGVDSFFMSKVLESWIVIEADEILAKQTTHNFQTLGAMQCTIINETAEDFLNTLPSDSVFDLVYLDPDRRPDATQKRAFRFEDCTPNLTEILTKLRHHTRYLVVKSSPMMDIQEGLSLLESAEVYVISVKNEVKELLWVVDLQQQNLAPAKVHAVELVYDWQSSSEIFPVDNFPLNLVEDIPSKSGYFILPSAGIMKAGLYKKMAYEQKWDAFSPSSHIYFSESKPSLTLPIRVFELINELPTNPKKFKKYGLKKAQVITKNDPLKPADLLKKYQLQEGGDDFILSCTNSTKKRIMVHTKRVV
jgi:hypothetical protein